MDNGSVVDTATATGTDTQGNTSPASNQSTETIDTVVPTPDGQPGQVGDRLPDRRSGGGLKVGDTIAYSYLVTNTGNVDLSSVTVNDPTIGTVTLPHADRSGPGPGGLGDLHGGDDPRVTQADVDNGSVTDTATATGTDTQGDPSPASNPVDRRHPGRNPAPAVSLAKIGVASGWATSTPPLRGRDHLVPLSGHQHRQRRPWRRWRSTTPPRGRSTAPPRLPGTGARVVRDLHRRQRPTRSPRPT